MTNKLVVIINSPKVPKIKKILLYEMKFLVPNYSRLQNPWLGGYRPQIPVLSVLCSQLNLLNPPPKKDSWVSHWYKANKNRTGDRKASLALWESKKPNRRLHGNLQDKRSKRNKHVHSSHASNYIKEPKHVKCTNKINEIVQHRHKWR